MQGLSTPGCRSAAATRWVSSALSGESFSAEATRTATSNREAAALNGTAARFCELIQPLLKNFLQVHPETRQHP